MQDDEDLLIRTKKLFYSNSTIYSDTEEEVDMRKNNKFLDFLDEDDRLVI